MGALFTAYDRPIYQRLIPQHLKDILSLPLPLMAHLHNGGFGVRLSESKWHAVVLDECHKMKTEMQRWQSFDRVQKRWSMYRTTCLLDQPA